MELARRRAILELLEEFPGLHVSEIARRLEWSPMLAEYHLRVLAKHDLVSRVEDDRYHRYYAKVEREGMRVDALGAREKRVLGMLRHPVRLHILTYLAVEGRGRNRDMARSLGLSRPATSYQLGRLLKAEIVTRDDAGVYELVEMDQVVRILLAFKPPSDLVEGLGDLWDRLRSV